MTRRTVGKHGLRGFRVARYARGASAITLSRAAYDQDHTQQTVPLAETIFFETLALDHRGLSSVRRLHNGDTAWSKEIWLGRSESNPEHVVGTKSGVMAMTIRRLEPYIDIFVTRGSRRTLERHLHQLPPTREQQTDEQSSTTSDSSSSSST